MNYAEVYSKLTYETAIIIFLKKNGEIRVMLGTRNLGTVDIKYGFQGQVLGGHDRRCNINNGNLAVYDLAIGDARSFHIDRLINIEYLGIIDTEEKYDKIFEQYINFKTEYEKTKPQTLDMNTFD